MRNTELSVIILLLGLTTVCWTLSIAPNHDEPCVVGDAWTEECLSCVCAAGRIIKCRPTFCASKLIQNFERCKEGERTKVRCNICVCRNGKQQCTSKHCSSS